MQNPRLSPHILASFGAFAAVATLSTSHAFSQGIERDSVSGESAEAALKASNAAPQPYNLAVGPVSFQTDASFIGTYDDNINVAHTGRLSDIILEPRVDIDGTWKVTELNSVNLDLGLGYQFYTDHTGASGPVISPDSNLQFNLFVDDVKINFHDSFLYQQDPVEVGDLSNISQFSRFQNDGGIRADWDLGQIIASVGWDHTNYWVFQSAYQYLDSDTDSFSPRVTYKVSSTINAGLETSVAFTRFDQNIQNDSTSFSVGPFTEIRLSDNLAVDARFGYYQADYTNTGLNGDNSNVSSFYAEGGITHRVNSVLYETLTAGRQYIPGLTSNYTEEIYARYAANYQAPKYFSITPTFSYQNLQDSISSFHETSNIYQLGITFGYQLTQHLNVNAGYQYVLKDADITDLSYYQDSVSLGATYKF